MPLARGRDPICAQCSSSRNRQPILSAAVREDAPIQSPAAHALLQPGAIAGGGSSFLGGRQEWRSGFGNFSGLIRGTQATYQCSGGALGVWPDGHASEEYQTQSYFCLSTRSAPDGSQGLLESPPVLPAHLNTTTHTETTQSWVYIVEPQVSPSAFQ